MVGQMSGYYALQVKLKTDFCFCQLDQYPLDPHFRAARQSGQIEVWELDEGMLHWGLRAAAMDLPFLPTRIGIGTDIINQPGFEFIDSPYEDGETFGAMPAINLEAALIHAHRSDVKGNILTMSPDPFFDELFSVPRFIHTQVLKKLLRRQSWIWRRMLVLHF